MKRNHVSMKTKFLDILHLFFRSEPVSLTSFALFWTIRDNYKKNNCFFLKSVQTKFSTSVKSMLYKHGRRYRRGGGRVPSGSKLCPPRIMFPLHPLEITILKLFPQYLTNFLYFPTFPKQSGRNLRRNRNSWEVVFTHLNPSPSQTPHPTPIRNFVATPLSTR